MLHLGRKKEFGAMIVIARPGPWTWVYIPMASPTERGRETSDGYETTTAPSEVREMGCCIRLVSVAIVRESSCLIIMLLRCPTKKEKAQRPFGMKNN